MFLCPTLVLHQLVSFPLHLWITFKWICFFIQSDNLWLWTEMLMYLLCFNYWYIGMYTAASFRIWKGKVVVDFSDIDNRWRWKIFLLETDFPWLFPFVSEVCVKGELKIAIFKWIVSPVTRGKSGYSLGSAQLLDGTGQTRFDYPAWDILWDPASRGLILIWCSCS